MEDFNDTSVPLDYSDYDNIPLPLHVMNWSIICLGPPLIVLAICALVFLVKNDHVAPIYIINLLISDLIQICSTTTEIVSPEMTVVISSSVIYLVSLMANIGFMVCVTVERYLVIAYPMWYRFKRNIKASVLVCVIVWLFPLAPVLLNILTSFNKSIIFAIFFLLPFPVLIFSVVGTLKSLSGVISVSSEEKQRIVATLVLVLFNYTVFFLPLIVCLISSSYDYIFLFVSASIIRISPLADLILYVFMGKGATRKLLVFLCHCKKDAQQQQEGRHGVTAVR